MAEDWLAIAAREVAYIPSDILVDACAHARRTCHHHGKIVPTIIAYADPIIEQRRILIRSSQGEAKQLELRNPERWVPEPGELDALKEQAAREVERTRSALNRKARGWDRPNAG